MGYISQRIRIWQRWFGAKKSTGFPLQLLTMGWLEESELMNYSSALNRKLILCHHGNLMMFMTIMMMMKILVAMLMLIMIMMIMLMLMMLRMLMMLLPLMMMLMILMTKIVTK